MNNSMIEGKEYLLNKVFCDDYSFEIPHYQRPYLWEADEHVKNLWDDILDAIDGLGNENIKNADPYFLGSIVLIKVDREPHSIIIDGQQRLITLTILLSALRDTLENEEKAQDLQKYLFERGDSILGTSPRYRLQIRAEDRDYFLKYIQKPRGIRQLLQSEDSPRLTISQENIRKNAIFLLKKSQALSEDFRQALTTFIVMKCMLVVVTSPNQNSAYRIFSILNDRGMNLSHADILKADIVGKLPPEKSEELARKWEDAENELGRDNFGNLFGYIRMIYQKQKTEKSILQEFRDHVISKHDPKCLIEDVILPYADIHQDIMLEGYSSASQAEKVNEIFSWLKQIDNSDWIPPAMKFLFDNRENTESLIRFFTDLERLAAVMMILRTYRTKRIERYGKVLRQLESESDILSDGSELQLTDNEKRETIKVLDGDIYTLRNAPKYVLLRLDSFLSEGIAKYDRRNIQIEHVLPQNPKVDSEWMTDFPSIDEQKELVHKLGNLVLLSQRKNRDAWNYDFDRKKEQYFRKGKSSPIVLTAQVLQEPIWTPTVIRRRQRQLLEQLKELWRLN